MMTDVGADRSAFVDGVRRAADAGGLLHHLFGVRSRGLFGELPDTASASYLSGLLIGHEIRAAGPTPGTVVHLLCTPELADIYRQALHALGMESSTLDANAVTRGLFRLASRLKK
jgi:2-dehydro-3-deoxygalactonokinase